MITTDEDLENTKAMQYRAETTILVKESCFYDLCDKQVFCWGKLYCGKFKHRGHALFCSICGLMTFALLVAVIVPVIIYRLVDAGIDSEVVIDSTHASSYEAWSTNIEGSGYDDTKITYNLYLFDLQNAADVLNGAKPVVVETGPYVYDEYFRKFDIVWSDGGDTVTYNTLRYYVYNQQETGAGLTEFDNITLPYPTVLGFEYLLDQLPPGVDQALDEIIEGRLLGKESEILSLTATLTGDVLTFPMLPSKRKQLLAQLATANQSVQVIFADLTNLTETTDTGDLLLKSLLCNVPSGISPFFVTNPSPAWFGWLNDPVLLEVQNLINVISAKTGKVIPWTSGVPGATNNYTSIDDTRRRRNVDVLKTGKKNLNQISQYVRYQNMTEYWTCIAPANSAAPYVEGSEFAACEHFQYEWDEATATAKGYTKPFATDYANRVQGTDGNMFARPVRSKKLQVFISDIYRSVYLAEEEEVDWHGITLKKYGLQNKDLQNSTMNPENAQYYAFGHNGVENGTKASNIPVFISFPHFLYADVQLQEAIKGLHPNEDLHSTYLSIEPQTGLLVQAHKRLQVNYYMEPYSLPEISQYSVQMAETLCADLQNVVNELAPLAPANTTLPDISCNLTIITPLFTCLAQPSKWNLPNDLYMPYGWVSEDMVLPDSDADDLQNSLFVLDDVAEGVRFWSLVVAGGCFLTLVALLIQMYYQSKEENSPSKERWRDFIESPSAPRNDDFTFNPSVDSSIHRAVEPLLPTENGLIN